MMEIVEFKLGDDIVRAARADATWMGVIDLVGKTPMTVTIERCVRFKDATFEKGRKESGQALIFKGSPKMLIINATRRKSLVKKFQGATPEKMIGKEVTLNLAKLDREFNGHTHTITLS